MISFGTHKQMHVCLFKNILHQLCINYPAVPIDLVLHIFWETFDLQIRTVPQKTQCAGKDFPARRQHRPSGLRVSWGWRVTWRDLKVLLFLFVLAELLSSLISPFCILLQCPKNKVQSPPHLPQLFFHETSLILLYLPRVMRCWWTLPRWRVSPSHERCHAQIDPKSPAVRGACYSPVASWSCLAFKMLGSQISQQTKKGTSTCKERDWVFNVSVFLGEDGEEHQKVQDAKGSKYIKVLQHQSYHAVSETCWGKGRVTARSNWQGSIPRLARSERDKWGTGGILVSGTWEAWEGCFGQLKRVTVYFH